MPHVSHHATCWSTSRRGWARIRYHVFRSQTSTRPLSSPPVGVPDRAVKFEMAASASMFIPVYVSLCMVYSCLAITYRRRFYRMVFKCLPVLCLFLWTVLALAALANNGDDDDEEEATRGLGGSEEPAEGEERSDVGRVVALLLGLLLSCAGDACLVYPRAAAFGIASFSLAHVLYMRVFGLSLATFSRLAAPGWLLTGLFAASSVALLFVVTRVAASFRVVLPRTIRALALLYFGLVSAMLLSALLRWHGRTDVPSAVGLVGAFLFCCSDLLLGATLILEFMLLQARVLVILTYYAAQLCIVMSVLLEAAA